MTEDTGHSNRDAASAERPTERPKLKRKEYEMKLRELQTELCSLQNWVKRTGQRIIVVFEGRDAAGKGGAIRALTERVSPRTFRSCSASRAVRSRENPGIWAAILCAFPGSR